MLASTLTHWEELAVIVASVLTVIGAIWRGIGRPILKLVAQGEENERRLDKIAKEFEKNAGSTLRDGFDRLERRQAETHRMVVVIDERQTAAEHQREALARQLVTVDERLARVEGNQ